ncbi:MAG: ParB/RepB/Spo0J family partition protein [Steroidobacteraceae bacterium]
MIEITGTSDPIGNVPAENGGTTAAGTRPGSSEIVELDPFECRVWASHDRPEDELTEAGCRDEMEHIRMHGQVVPAIGRPVLDETDCKVEIICGARRLFIARQLGISLRVELRRLSDHEAFALMDGENRLRRDLSCYARGMSYASALRRKMFRSQRELARALGISVTQVTRCVMLANLPAIVIDAFPKPADIRERWGVVLHQVCQDQKLRAAMLERARRLAAIRPRLPPEEAYRKLVRDSVPHRAKARDEVIRDPRTNRIICRIRDQRAVFWLGFPKNVVDNDRRAKLLALAQRIIQAQWPSSRCRPPSA